MDMIKVVKKRINDERSFDDPIKYKMFPELKIIEKSDNNEEREILFDIMAYKMMLLLGGIIFGVGCIVGLIMGI